MTKCPKCGKEVKYIDTLRRGMLTCEAEAVEGVTENGRILQVRLIHECKFSEPGPNQRIFGIA